MHNKPSKCIAPPPLSPLSIHQPAFAAAAASLSLSLRCSPFFPPLPRLNLSFSIVLSSSSFSFIARCLRLFVVPVGRPLISMFPPPFFLLCDLPNALFWILRAMGVETKTSALSSDDFPLLLAGQGAGKGNARCQLQLTAPTLLKMMTTATSTATATTTTTRSIRRTRGCCARSYSPHALKQPVPLYDTPCQTFSLAQFRV